MNGTYAWAKAARLFLGIDFTTHLLRTQWFQLQLQTGGQTYFSASLWFHCSTTANPKQTRNKNLTAKKKEKLVLFVCLQFDHSPVLNWHKENFKLIYFISKTMSTTKFQPVSVMLKSDWIEGVHICEFKGIYLHVSLYKFIHGSTYFMHCTSAPSDCWVMTAAGKASYYLAPQLKPHKILLLVVQSHNSRLRYTCVISLKSNSHVWTYNESFDLNSKDIDC